MTSDYTKIIDVYRENIQSGDLTSVNPKSIKLPCTDTRCVTSTKEIYGELYYQRDDVYSYSYSTIYLDNMILGTTFSKTANQPEIDMKYIKQTLYIEKGVLVEVAKGSYLYIK